MARGCGTAFSFDVYLRFGELTVGDVAYAEAGRENLGWDWRPEVPVNQTGSNRTTRLDPGLVGKLIVGHAVPRPAFTGFDWTVYEDLESIATGAPSLGNLYRTGARLMMDSDGIEARFSLISGPHLLQSADKACINVDDRLSCLTVFDTDYELMGEGPFLVAPWRDPELLGHCVLRAFELVGPPLGKNMPESVFIPLAPKGRIGMHRAALSSDLGLLPKRPSRVDPPDREGITPLMLAAGAGHGSMVRALLDLGADCASEDSQCRTALHHAATSGSVSVVEILLAAGADAGAVDAFGETALHVAASRGDVRVVEALVAACADVNVSDLLYGSTPLHRAARGNHGGVIEVLAAAGASVDARNEAGRTALQVAAAFASPGAVSVLLNAGANVNATDHRLETALHRPVLFQHLDIIAMLLEFGVDVGAADFEGNTALHVAALMNRHKAAELLLAADADVDAFNTEGLTALDLAIVNRHVGTLAFGVEHNAEVADVLLAHGATIVPHRLPVADRHVLWPQLTPRRLLRRGTSDIDYQRLKDIPTALRQKLQTWSKNRNHPPVCINVIARSLMHDAVAKDLPRVVQALLDSGASPMTSVRGNQIGPPLHVAVETGNIAMAKLLLERGANPNMQTGNQPQLEEEIYHFSLTPLLLATQANNSEMVTLLLEYGADVNCHTARINQQPRTPTDYAEPGTELHELLRANGGKTAKEQNIRWTHRPY